MAWNLHIELSFCFCLQQLLLSVLEAYTCGWVLLWHPEPTGSLPGDGRARPVLAFCPPRQGDLWLSLLTRPLPDLQLLWPFSWRSSLLWFYFTLSRSSLLRSWGLMQWGTCRVWQLLLLLSLVISCDHQQSVVSSTALFTWPCCAGLGHHGAHDLLTTACGKLCVSAVLPVYFTLLLVVLPVLWSQAVSLCTPVRAWGLCDSLDCGRLLEVWVSQMNCWLQGMCPSQMQEEPNTVSHHAGSPWHGVQLSKVAGHVLCRLLSLDSALSAFSKVLLLLFRLEFYHRDPFLPPLYITPCKFLAKYLFGLRSPYSFLSFQL